MTDNLKSCPFCGGVAELDIYRDYRAINGAFGKEAAIFCTACSADIVFCYPDANNWTEDEIVASLISRWNRRASEEVTKVSNMPRPHKRPDGIPTRADVTLWSPAEKAIGDAMAAVEAAGASPALTDAVTLLEQARDRVADHVESEAA